MIATPMTITNHRHGHDHDLYSSAVMMMVLIGIAQNGSSDCLDEHQHQIRLRTLPSHPPSTTIIDTTRANGPVQSTTITITTTLLQSITRNVIR